ncbi:hypothetical protein [Methanobrevibacter arboriphilus]|jgi:hypothetical protein|uniref:Uncharacterized protein n=1 Tax=Methanobrevibacter arboriphilus TaxID=39441 RepID=A0ACA8R2I2_METAZ|nr:hypothetical protein [Methanobrevibacter arboriphilus]BBL61488.1 hypothetical protein MarbSA_05280 [Methanobrevibacter arboriphilus]
MIKTILAIIGGIFILLIVGSMAAGFLLTVDNDNQAVDKIIKENLTISDADGVVITPSQEYNLINSSEYGLCVEVPLKYYPVAIFEPNTTIKINDKDYVVVDYINLNVDGETNDLVAVESV